jgi:hypothetical protein
MQFVSDNDFLNRFVDLFLDNKDIDSKLDISVDFIKIEYVIKRNEKYFYDKFTSIRDTYLLQIRDKIVEYFILNKGYCNELLKKNKNSNRESPITMDTVVAQNKFKYIYILALLPDSIDVMEQFFSFFANPKKIILLNKVNRKTRNDLMSYATKINNLSKKERESVYYNILSMRNSELKEAGQ